MPNPWDDLVTPTSAPGAIAAPPPTSSSWGDLVTPTAAPAAPAMPSEESDLSNNEKYYKAQANHGWIGKILAANGAFQDQATRAMTTGLSDKVSALAPATIQAAAKGVNALYGAIGAEHPFPEAEKEDFSDTYHSELAKSREAGERYSKDNPYASFAAKALGTAAMIPLTGGTTGVSPAALVTSAPTAAVPLSTAIGQGAKGGAAIGGLAGFGQSNDESFAKDALDTGVGAAAGGVLGAGATYATDKVVSPIVQWLSGVRGQAGVQAAADKGIIDRISKNAEAGGPTAQDMLDALNASPNKPLMIADVGGTGPAGMGEGLANKPGQAQQIITKALKDRDAGAGARLTGDIDENLASGASTFTTDKVLAAAREAASQPLYTKAYAANQSMMSPKISNILATPAGKTALSDAAEQMQNKMSLMGPSDPELTALKNELVNMGKMANPDTGGTGVASGLKMESLDLVKRNLYDQAKALKQQGQNTKASNIDSLRIGLTKEMDALDTTVVPATPASPGNVEGWLGRPAQAATEAQEAQPGAYAQARAAFSGPASSSDALEEGSKFMTKSPSQIASEVGDLEAGDQEFYRLGAANALKTNVAKAANGADEAKRISGNDYLRKQISSLAETPEAGQKLIDSALAESRMFDTNTNTLGNSRTVLRAAENAAQNPEGGTMGALAQTAGGIMTGEPVVSGMGMLKLGSKLGQVINRPNPAVEAAQARTLYNPNLKANQEALARLLASTSRPALNGAGVAPIAALGGGAYPALTRIAPSYLGGAQ